MKVLVTGSSGLVGSALMQRLREVGHDAVPLIRDGGPNTGGQPVWAPEKGELDPAQLQGFNAVVNLAGENVAGGRWTERRKARIRDSRVKGTELLSRAIAEAEPRPEVLVSVSAVGYYGHRGDDLLEEDAGPGEGFLPEVCAAWENATTPASDAGVRVVNPRIGMVLSAQGGALAKMLTPFKLGLGGPIGDGQQFVSWISIDDLANAILHCLDTAALSGPVNTAGPFPVTNQVFSKMLGKVLRRPAVLPVPAFAVRTLFGEMADALLLASARVSSRKLEESGFQFAHRDVETALRAMLGKD